MKLIRLIQAAMLVAVVLLAGCDERATLHVVTTPGAPAPPSEPAFATLPSRNEVLEMIESFYENLDGTVELVGPWTGDVRWVAVGKTEYGYPGYWVFHPKSRFVASAATAQLPAAEQLRVDSVRWRYVDGQWQVDGMFNAYATLFRGIDDPDDEQVAALLQQPGIQYAFHKIGSVPRKIRLLRPARAARDAAGFSDMQYPVEFIAETDLIDFPGQQLHRSDVTLRAVVYCDVREGKWRARDEVELLASKHLSSRPANDEELFKHHWAMDGWWRYH